MNEAFQPSERAMVRPSTWAAELMDHPRRQLSDADLAARVVAKSHEEIAVRSELAELRAEQRRRAAVVAAKYHQGRTALREKRRELSPLGKLERRVGLELATVVASCPYIGPIRVLGIATVQNPTEHDLSRRLGMIGKRWLRQRFAADGKTTRFTELLEALKGNSL